MRFLVSNSQLNYFQALIFQPSLQESLKRFIQEQNTLAQ